MPVKRRRRIMLSDVYAIPLPDGRFAFGRRFKDATIAIYKHIGKTNVPVHEEYQFTVGIYNYVLKSDEWTTITNRPFENEESDWPPPPPSCIIDPLNGSFSIHHKGDIIPSDKENVIRCFPATRVWIFSNLFSPTPFGHFKQACPERAAAEAPQGIRMN